MSNPYQNPYVHILKSRIRGTVITMEAMEEAMVVDLMVSKEVIIMILINLDIKVMGMDIIRAIGTILQKMQLIVVHVWVQLAVLVVFFQCACVDFMNLFLQPVLIKRSLSF